MESSSCCDKSNISRHSHIHPTVLSSHSIGSMIIQISHMLCLQRLEVVSLPPGANYVHCNSSTVASVPIEILSLSVIGSVRMVSIIPWVRQLHTTPFLHKAER